MHTGCTIYVGNAVVSFEDISTSEELLVRRKMSSLAVKLEQDVRLVVPAGPGHAIATQGKAGQYLLRDPDGNINIVDKELLDLKYEQVKVTTVEYTVVVDDTAAPSILEK